MSQPSTAVRAVQGAAILAGVVALLFLPGPAARFAPGVAEWLALPLILLGVWFAAWTARLPPGARHLYNFHYMMLAGAASTGYLLLLPEIIRATGFERWAWLPQALLYIAGPGAIAHLVASSTERPRLALLLAGVASCVIAVASLPRWSLPFGVVAAGALVFAGMPVDGEKPRQTGAAWGVFGYILVNIYALLALMPIVCTMGMFFFVPDRAQLSYSPAVYLQEAVEGLDSFLMLAAVRLAIGIAGGLGAFAAVWLMPVARATRGGTVGAALCLVLAAMLAGQTSTSAALWALGAALLLFVAAGAAVAHLPRKGRLPFAMIAFAGGLTLCIQLRAVPVDTLFSSATLWMVEAVALAAAWLPAYLAGAGPLRAREELHFREHAQP